MDKIVQIFIFIGKKIPENILVLIEIVRVVTEFAHFQRSYSFSLKICVIYEDECRYS